MSAWDRWWEELIGFVAADLEVLAWGSFLIVEYDLVRLGIDGPYAQTSRGAAGYYCEAVSDPVGTGAGWPFDQWALERRGWQPPDRSTANWWIAGIDTAVRAAELLLRSLVEARGCTDPDLVFLVAGTHPPRGGGQPLPTSEVLSGGARRWAA